MAITNISILPPAVQQSFDEVILSTPTPNHIHNVAAQKKTMPAHGGTTLRMRRYNPLDAAMVPLDDSGEYPPSQELTAVDIDAKIQQYGTWLHINEKCVLTNEDPILNAAAVRLGAALRLTEDQLTRDMLAGTAAMIYCTGGVNGDTPTELTRSDVDEVVETLLTADAKTVLENVEAEDRIGTGPVPNSFIAMCHTNLIKDMNSVDGFIHKNAYPSQTGLLKSERGSIGDVRFLISSIGSISTRASNLNKDVYNIFVSGMEAYAYIEQDMGSASFIYHGPEYDGPLELNSTAGFKMWQVPRILNDAWLIKLCATLG